MMKIKEQPWQSTKESGATGRLIRAGESVNEITAWGKSVTVPYGVKPAHTLQSSKSSPWCIPKSKSTCSLKKTCTNKSMATYS